MSVVFSRVFCLLLCLLMCLLSACSSTSEGRRQLSLVSQEKINRNGERAFQRFKNRSIQIKDEVEVGYIKCVVDSLSKANPSLAGQWEVALLRDDQPNAFAFPGHKMVINSGLLRFTLDQHQLATVIAHEMAHIQAGHGAESTSHQVALEGLSLVAKLSVGRGMTGTPFDSATDIARTGLIYPMGKVQEEEADLIGIELMAKAGFDQRQALQFWKNMEVFGNLGSGRFLSTHPTHRQRMASLEKRIHQREAERSASPVNQKVPKCDI